MRRDLLQMDCSAIVYPYLATDVVNHSFTMEADIDREIDPALLLDVTQSLCERFPTMFVRLVKDAFGYKLEHVHDVTPFVMPRPQILNEIYDFDNNDHLIRITYRSNRLAVECFHSVTDGSGAITLLKTILAEYYRRLGEEIPCELGVLSPEEDPHPTETEDSFRTNYRKEAGTVGRLSRRAFHFREDGPFEVWHQTELSVPLDELKPIVKACGATVTEYVSSMYLYAFYQLREKVGGKKPVVLSVPINLRTMFESETLRNFSLYFLANQPAGEVTFETILQSVKADFRSGTDKDLIQQMINANVSQQEMAIFRALPRPLKRMALRIGSAFCGECLFTSTLSNLGVFKVPEALASHMLAFRAILGPVPGYHIHTTAYCVNGVFSLMFASRLASREVEQTMAEMFRERGMHPVMRDEKELLPIPVKTAE